MTDPAATTSAPGERGVRLAVVDGVATVVIDRPQRHNAIDRNTMAALGAVLDRVEAGVEAGGITVLALRGGGDRVFISGGDLKELAQIRTEAEATAMSRTMRTVLDRVATLPIPTVALLNGDAYGGGAEVAVACDLRVAADDVKIGFNQVALAIMPAWGGIERLTSLVGRGRALQLLLTGAVLPAEVATAMNLVEYVVPRERFDAEATALLTGLAPCRQPRRGRSSRWSARWRRPPSPTSPRSLRLSSPAPGSPTSTGRRRTLPARSARRSGRRGRQRARSHPRRGRSDQPADRLVWPGAADAPPSICASRSASARR